MLRVGLTGGIGAGKTLVSNLFAELGIPVVDADKISRELTATPDAPGSRAIRDRFGPDFFLADGQLDRRKLRETVFTEPRRLRELEAILHPLVRNQIGRELDRLEREGHPYCIVSIPLLIEAGMDDLVDRIIVVDAPESLQLERVIKRDASSVDETRKILSRQASREARLAHADFVIDNSTTPKATHKQVVALDRQLRSQR